MIDDIKRPKKVSQKPQIPIEDSQINDELIDLKDSDADSFLTPDQMAALDEAEVKSPIGDEVPKKKPKKKKKFNLRWPKNKKEWALTILLIILIAVGSYFVYMKYIKKEPIKLPVHSKSNKVPSKLSGLMVDPSANKRPVIGVMIENSKEARPQSGLYDASVVFEAIAEGGITRFLALYQDTQPEDIGPIRSARPYYAQWVLGFDASYAHVGGSPAALRDIKNWQVRDLDQFANGNSYRRVNSKPSPHNVYSSYSALSALADSKGYGTSDFKGFDRKSSSPAKTPTAINIDFNISSALYNVNYVYDAKSNSYKRSEGGQPHVDALANKQINPKVVIALIMPYSLEADRIHSSYETIGTGQAYIFQDGKVAIGSWTKETNQDQFIFKDENDKLIKLNPGKTWLTALGENTRVKYSP